MCSGVGSSRDSSGAGDSSSSSGSKLRRTTWPDQKVGVQVDGLHSDVLDDEMVTAAEAIAVAAAAEDAAAEQQ